MKSTWRRYEVLLPVEFNDGSPVPAEVLGEVQLEVVEQFGASTYQAQPMEGLWLHAGTLYRDNLTRLIVDIPNSPANRRWMKQFKARWKAKLKQLELWMVSYRIDVE